MTSLTEREKAFEAKYEHDQEIAFKVHVRQIKLFGLWAAGRMGLSKDEASAYAKKLIDSDIEKRGGDALRIVLKDFTAKGIDVSERQLGKELERLLAVAKAEVMTETGH